MAGHGSVDLELVTHLRNSDGQELGRLLDDSLVCLLVEEDSVVNLFLDLDLGPALLLRLGGTGLLAWCCTSLGLSLVSLGVLLVNLLCLLTNEHEAAAYLPYLMMTSTFTY